MVLAQCRRSKRTQPLARRSILSRQKFSGFSAHMRVFEALPPHSAAAGAALSSGEVALQFNLAGRVRIGRNFHGHAPHERFYPAGAGVVFATIKERELHAKFSRARFKGVEGNS